MKWQLHAHTPLASLILCLTPDGAAFFGKTFGGPQHSRVSEKNILLCVYSFIKVGELLRWKLYFYIHWIGEYNIFFSLKVICGGYNEFICKEYINEKIRYY